MGVPLAPARGRGDRRGPAGGRDRPGRRRRRRREPAPRHVAREARVAEAGVRPGGDDDGGQRAGRERRRRRASSSRARSGRAGAGSSRSRRSSRRGTSPTSSPTSRARPAQAAAVALERAGKTIDDVARVEINEAFSSVAKHSTRLLGADEERVNVNGGAVALGHPIGASGGSHPRDDGARAAPQRRRARARRDLLRRRPGRRAADRGVSVAESCRDRATGDRRSSDCTSLDLL